MKIYKVGGCIRDELLNKKPKDIDYVVINSSEEEMLKLGFEKVGKSFPVFLHPDTRDEYALARTEKNTGNGYNDFITNTKNVSLIQDLKRRDLTINAIAKDENNNYIDPFNGIQDIKNKILRHTSEKFIEDPLRIIRIARFNARYPEFKIAKETKILIKEMINKDMLKNITNERYWKEISRVFFEKKPFLFFKILNEFDALKYIIKDYTKDSTKNIYLIEKVKKLNLFLENKKITDFEKIGIYYYYLVLNTENNKNINLPKIKEYEMILKLFNENKLNIKLTNFKKDIKEKNIDNIINIYELLRQKKNLLNMILNIHKFNDKKFNITEFNHIYNLLSEIKFNKEIFNKLGVNEIKDTIYKERKKTLLKFLSKKDINKKIKDFI